MRFWRLPAVAGVLALLTLTGCSPREESEVPAPEPIVEPTRTEPAAPASTPPQASGSHAFTAQLSGTSGPEMGDQEGSGTAQVVIDGATGEVCYELTAENIEPSTMAHIHVGGSQEAGGVVVPLEAPTEGRVSGCVTPAAEVAAAIIENPEGYYVNVHNEPFPGGAIRGQLTR